ncbi:MAG: hypothetical protein HY717_03495 [Planctomycetes bacterium]|nr:hypothetical protein [Planctomycetota bacterium]
MRHDLRSPPAFYRSRAFPPLVLWGLLAASGLALSAVPSWRAAVGLSPVLVWIETAFALWAGASSCVSACFDWWFKRIELAVPKAARACEPFETTLQVDTHRPVKGVTIEAELVDRYFELHPEGKWESRTQKYEQHELARRVVLYGGSTHGFTAIFTAPMPLTAHESMANEMLASLLSLAGWLVPLAGHAAENMREHGGYFVRFRLRVGLVRRTFEKRIISYYEGKTILVG